MPIFRWLKLKHCGINSLHVNHSSVLSFLFCCSKCHTKRVQFWPSNFILQLNRISWLTFIFRSCVHLLKAISRCFLRQQWLSFSYECWLIRHWVDGKRSRVSLPLSAPPQRIRNRFGDINLLPISWPSERNPLDKLHFQAFAFFLSNHLCEVHSWVENDTLQSYKNANRASPWTIWFPLKIMFNYTTCCYVLHLMCCWINK